ncbi:zinc finger BED domain-containing protein 6-like [Hyperolius riggenbachi]|uniref:zinc finger BED domain-containing protein 6-like n=1 Tax=Hyperolius riggenbachi TaxID=752182 RepID=UPI0035A3A682
MRRTNKQDVSADISTDGKYIRRHLEDPASSDGGLEHDPSDHPWTPTLGEEEGSSEEEAEHRIRRSPGKGTTQRTGDSSRPITQSDGTLPWQQATTVTSSPTFRSSAVWAFFTLSSIDHSIAICNLCQQQISRGRRATHLGTTAMRRHMDLRHKAQWEQQQNRAPPSAAAPSASSTTREEPHQGAMDSSRKRRRQHLMESPSSTMQSLEQRTWPPHHPTAQALTSSLAKLLALQLIPLHLVDTLSFREFVAIGTPQWQVPSCRYFADKAIPALYRHVQHNVMASLNHAISRKVHLTTDAWSSKDGQRRYVSFTAHWVTLLAAGRNAGPGTPLELMSPPRLWSTSGTITSNPTFPPSSLTSSSGLITVQQQHPRTFGSSQAKRCSAVLQLVYLGNKNLTGPELLSALCAQSERWLNPRHLTPGKVVCDNDCNLLGALQLGKLTHVPCLAHVLHLVVQRFINKFPSFQEVLRQARRVCGHFLRSYTASARLKDFQRQNNLPAKRLICDDPTRWNSTLAMLQRLHQQQRAINDYLYEYETRTVSGDLGFFSLGQWLDIKDACSILSPFEEATNMVNSNSVSMSVTIPLLFLLDHTLRGIIDRALETQQGEDEDTLLSQAQQGNLPSASSAVMRGQQEAEDMYEEEEELLGAVGEEEETVQSSSGGFHASQTLVRGWGEAVEDNVVLSDTEDLGSSAAENLRKMGMFMLQCLRKDPKIQAIKENDNYWLSTFLDPRYKQKMSEFLPPSQRESKMRQLAELLRINLMSAFPDGLSQVSLRDDPCASDTAMPERRNPNISGGLIDNFHLFFQTQQSVPTFHSSHRQRLDSQINGYMGYIGDVDSLSTKDPLDYWVSKLDTWPELAQYAIEILSCPASSILSEGTFRAEGRFVNEKRTHLPTNNVDRLTFIKMNQAWITKDYKPPEA